MAGTNRKLKVTIVGAGSVGSVFARLLKQRGHSIVSVISKNRRSAQSLARLVRCRIAADDLSAISEKTTFLLIATPEEAIGPTAGSIASAGNLSFQTMYAAHTSGAMSSDLLTPLAERGVRTFSLHPIQSFPKKKMTSVSLDFMKGVWYGFEGVAAARPFARSLVTILGGKLLEVPKEKKILYHLACVFASNYPVVILGAVESLARQVSQGDISPFKKLFDNSSANAFELGASTALTGPIARGSVETIRRHMLELNAKEPGLLAIYSALGLHALEMLVQNGLLREESARHMESLLTGNDDR